MGKQRERNRIKSSIDELPEEMKELVNKRLADTKYSYPAISKELTKLGYPISKSAIGRYAIRHGGAAARLKESAEKIKVLAEVVKENRDMEASEVAGAILNDLLIERLATAGEDIDNVPLDKVGRLVVSLQRSVVYKEKFKLEYSKGFKTALVELKKELAAELQKEPELLGRMVELANRVAERMENREE